MKQDYYSQEEVTSLKNALLYKGLMGCFRKEIVKSKEELQKAILESRLASSLCDISDTMKSLLTLSGSGKLIYKTYSDTFIFKPNFIFDHFLKIDKMESNSFHISIHERKRKYIDMAERYLDWVWSEYGV